MVKSELCKLLARKFSHISEQDVLQATNLLLEFMRTNLCTLGRVEIRGFGSLSLKYRKPRLARNPRTGKILMTSGRYRPHFKPGKELKERVNEAKSKE